MFEEPKQLESRGTATKKRGLLRGDVRTPAEGPPGLFSGGPVSRV